MAQHKQTKKDVTQLRCVKFEQVVISVIEDELEDKIPEDKRRNRKEIVNIFDQLKSERGPKHQLFIKIEQKFDVMPELGEKMSNQEAKRFYYQQFTKAAYKNIHDPEYKDIKKEVIAILTDEFYKNNCQSVKCPYHLLKTNPHIEEFH